MQRLHVKLPAKYGFSVRGKPPPDTETVPRSRKRIKLVRTLRVVLDARALIQKRPNAGALIENRLVR